MIYSSTRASRRKRLIILVLYPQQIISGSHGRIDLLRFSATSRFSVPSPPPDGSFEPIKDISVNGYRDDSSTGLQLATEYYYYVVSVDNRGRSSDASVILSGAIEGDTTPPVILKYYPADGDELYLAGELGMSVEDNFKLSCAKIEYRKSGGSNWLPVTEFYTDAISTEFKYFWDVTELSGEAYELRYSVEDSAGNSAEPIVIAISIREYAISDADDNVGGYGPHGDLISPIDPPAAGSIAISTIDDFWNMTANGKYHLTNDLDLAGIDYISQWTYDKPFSGVFDGQGYAIKNMHITNTTRGTLLAFPDRKRFSPDEWDFAGLFGYTDWATIRNLVMDNPKIILNDPTATSMTRRTIGNPAKYINVGSIVSWMNGGRLSSCTTKDGVECISQSGGSVNAGGLVGYCSDSLIDHSYNTADIEINGENLNCGGIIGDIFFCSITHCFNFGDVSGNGTMRVASGGIGGRISVDWYFRLEYDQSNAEFASSLYSLYPLDWYTMTAYPYAAYYPQYLLTLILNSFNAGAINAVGGKYAVAAGIYGCTEDNAQVNNCYSSGGISVYCATPANLDMNLGGHAAGIAADFYMVPADWDGISTINLSQNNCV